MHKVKRSADAVNIVMYAMVISIAGLILLDTFTNGDHKIFVLLLGNTLILCAIYAFRVFIRKMPVFVLLHVLLLACCIALAVLIPDAHDAICAGLFSALAGFAMLLDLLFWANAVKIEKEMPVAEDGTKLKNFRPVYKEGLPYIPLSFVAVFLLGIVYSVYTAKPYYGKIAYILGVIFIGLFFLRMYLYRMGRMIENMHREQGELPTRLLKSNARLTVPVLVLLFAAMFLLQSEYLVHLFDQIVLLLIKGALWIFSLFIRFLSFLGNIGGSGTTIRMESAVPQYDGAPGMFARFMEYLLSALVFGTLFFLIIRGVVRFVRHFGMRSVNRETHLSAAQMTEVRERLSGSRRGRSGRRFPGAKTPAERIRRFYRKYVIRQERRGLTVLPHETPLERVDALSRVSGREREEISELTRLYDVARYAPMQIREDDVSAMEKLV